MMLRRVTTSETKEVDALFDRLTSYSIAVDGIARRARAASDFIHSIPPGKGREHKHAFLIESDDEQIGLLDIIEDYPVAGVTFIGLLAIAEDRHGTGLGRAAYFKAEAFARDTLKAHTLRLGVVSSNPVSGFWRKMGFAPVSEVRSYEGEAKSSAVILMEKTIG